MKEVVAFFKRVVKSSWTKICNSRNHILSVFKSIIISGAVSTVLMILIFSFLPKSSWINLFATPDNFEVYDFTGKYVLTTNSMQLNTGTLTNSIETTVLIDDQVYEIKEGELEIKFVNDEKIDAVFGDEKFPDLFSCFTSFDKQVKINAYFWAAYGINKGNIQIKREYSTYRKDINIGLDLKDDEIYNILVRSDNLMRSSVLVYNDTSMTVHPNMQVFICGNKIDVPEGKSIKFCSDGSSEVGVLLDFSTDMVLYSGLDIDNYCYLFGKSTAFMGKSGGANGILKQTYLNTQKEFDVGLLTVGATAKEYFQLEYELSEQHHNIQISGLSKKITIADHSLNYSFSTFLTENLGAIISGIFAAFIAAYIPIVLANNTNEKEQDATRFERDDAIS